MRVRGPPTRSDLVVTSIVMAVLTWVIAGGLTLNDDFRQAPLKIASYPGGPPPRWVSIWPRMRPLFFNDPSREYLNFPNKFYGFLNNLKAGFYLGLLMALVVALPVSLFLMIKTSREFPSCLCMSTLSLAPSLPLPLTYQDRNSHRLTCAWCALLLACVSATMMIGVRAVLRVYC